MTDGGGADDIRDEAERLVSAALAAASFALRGAGKDSPLADLAQRFLGGAPGTDPDRDAPTTRETPAGGDAAAAASREGNRDGDSDGEGEGPGEPAASRPGGEGSGAGEPAAFRPGGEGDSAGEPAASRPGGREGEGRGGREAQGGREGRGGRPGERGGSERPGREGFIPGWLHVEGLVPGWRHVEGLLGGRQIATGSPECRYCPVCRGIAAVRNPSPEFAFKVAGGVTDVATGIASILRAFNSAPPRPRPQAAPHPRASDATWRAATKVPEAPSPAPTDTRPAGEEPSGGDDPARQPVEGDDPWHAATTAPAPSALPEDPPD